MGWKTRDPVQELAADRMRFMPDSRPIELISPVAGGGAADDYRALAEGAWVTLYNGYYYLFYSGNDCCSENPHYAVMVARSRSAIGPFETLAQASGEASSVVVAQNVVWYAPGHNSVVRDASGEDWLVYHAIDPKRRYIRVAGADSTMVRRVMLIDKVSYRDDWPRIEGGSPSAKRKPAPRLCVDGN